MSDKEHDPEHDPTRAGMLAQAGLRLVMLASDDPVARAIAREFLGETSAQALDELNSTCWKNDMQHPGQLREACIKYYIQQEAR